MMKKYHLYVSCAICACWLLQLVIITQVKAEDKVIVVPFLTSSGASNVVVVKTTDSIQDAINSLPADGGTVFLKAGLHTVSSGIVISKSNTTVTGEQGAVVKLGDGVDQPVILVGNANQMPVLGDLISNIHINNVEIDGNQANQTSETDPTRAWIRNNGIDIRTVSNLWIQNVKVHDGRSGGIVASWKSSSIFIDNVACYDNYYDGIALYDSEDVLVTNFLSYSNDNGAGLSLDNNLRRVVFDGGIIRNNADVGIFARDSEELTFSNLIITGNGSSGAFLSHDAGAPTTTGVIKVFFNGCSFFGNGGYGLTLPSASTYSHDNAVAGCLFTGNTSGCLSFASGSLVTGSNVCLP